MSVHEENTSWGSVLHGEERLAEKVEMITFRGKKFLKIIPNHIKSGQGWEHGMGQE